MRRLLKIAIGPVCAMIVMLSLNGTLIASAAAYPKNMEELVEEQGEDPAAVKEARNENISIGVVGYIVPLSSGTSDPKPGSPVTAIAKVPAVTPKTGDDSNMGLFTIAALSSLLLLLCLWAKKEKRDEI